MRDLFEEHFRKRAARSDRSGAARHAAAVARGASTSRPRWRTARASSTSLLDGRPVRTPARRPLAAPTRALAEALAAEWEAQRDVIDPANMPLTRLANTIIDGVADAAAAVAADVESISPPISCVYRADAPAGLVARQAAAWDPVLAWARDALGARFVLAAGDDVRHAARSGARRRARRDPARSLAARRAARRSPRSPARR